MFYNTTNTTNSTLKVYQQKELKQREVIHNFFKANPKLELTPFEVMTMINKPYIITSVRRTMTDLTYKYNVLEKVEDKRRMGLHGRENCLWRLSTNKD